MLSPLHFPSAEIVKQYLSNYELLNTNYNQKNGITEAIANLAAERFSDRYIAEMSVKMDVILMIHDLQEGVDGFTGEPLPNLGKIGLPQMIWTQITIATEMALIDCANNRFGMS